MTDRNISSKHMNFGDYCRIEQKRYVGLNEMYQYKVIGRLFSNCWVDVPVDARVANGGETHHDGMEEVISAICCGVSEREVLRFRAVDCRPDETDDELCPHGTTYQSCKRGCPPWRVVPPEEPKAARDAEHCDYPDCEQHNALVIERLRASIEAHRKTVLDIDGVGSVSDDALWAELKDSPKETKERCTCFEDDHGPDCNDNGCCGQCKGSQVKASEPQPGDVLATARMVYTGKLPPRKLDDENGKALQQEKP